MFLSAGAASGTVASSGSPPGRPAALRAAKADGEGSLQRRLLWLALFRAVANSLLLVALWLRLVTREPLGEPSPADYRAFGLVGLVFVLTVIYGLLLRRRQVGAWAALAQILGDVGIATYLVFLTGGVESPLAFTYSLAVVEAAVLLPRRGALLASLSSAVALVGLGLALNSGLIAAPETTAKLASGRLLFLLSSHVLAQALTGVLASYLGKQLSAAGGRLEAREEDLKELVGLQNQIVAAMPSGLITCDSEGSITFINPAAVSILGLGAPASRPANIEALVPGVLKLGPQIRRGELVVETPNGRRTLGLAVTPLQGQLEGARGSVLIVFQDLTELRRAEDELRRLDHLALLGKLSAQLAHEIRNPLASMRGSAQMLAEEARGAAGESAAESGAGRLANILIRESDRLSTLLDEFLCFARPGPPKLAEVELARLLEETVAMLRGDPLARGLDIELALTPIFVRVDESQLKQVLINLLRNAFLAVQQGGRVKVWSEVAEGRARVHVWDSAGSIPPENLGRIFEPFFTTRQGGTGLGLSTAHSIISAHGGRIRVSSSPDAGTDFTIELPLRA